MQSTSAPQKAALSHTAALNAEEREYLLPTDEKSDERGMGEAQKVSLTTSPRLRLLAMFINLLVVSEVFIAMYFAAQTPDKLTPVFFKMFFTMLVPTLVLAALARRHIAKAER